MRGEELSKISSWNLGSVFAVEIRTVPTRIGIKRNKSNSVPIAIHEANFTKDDVR